MVEIKKLITTRSSVVDDYRALGLDVELVPYHQHKVPYGQSLNVVEEMALNVDENVLVEDEVLSLDDGEVFDFAKMKQDLLQQCSKRAIKAKWEVNVAIRVGEVIETAHYNIVGSLKAPKDPASISRFEQMFFPHGYQQSLAQLQSTEQYQELNPRAKVLQVLQSTRYCEPDSFYYRLLAENVPKNLVGPRGETIGLDDHGFWQF